MKATIEEYAFQSRANQYGNDPFRYAVFLEIEKIIANSTKPILDDPRSKDAIKIDFWNRALHLYDRAMYSDIQNVKSQP